MGDEILISPAAPDDRTMEEIMESVTAHMVSPKIYPIRCIVAGSRTFADRVLHDRVITEVLSVFPKDDVELVSGMATDGPDAMIVDYAQTHGYALKEFPANWDLFGKKAGMVRNADMAKYGTHLVTFWDGASSGTANMMEQGIRYGLVRWHYYFDQQNQDASYFVPAFTATKILNNRIEGASTVFRKHAKYLASFLGYAEGFPEDHQTFPFERAMEAFKAIRKALWDDMGAVDDASVLKGFMSYVEDQQLYLTARRLETFTSPIPTLAAPMATDAAH